MSHKLSITVDDDVYSFIEKKASRNRSKFINDLIRERQQLDFEKELAEQLQQDNLDSEPSSDFAVLDIVAGMDGLEDWEDDWDDTKAPRNMVG